MPRKNRLMTQIEHLTYDKRCLHKNVLQWKASFDEVNKVLERKRKEKCKTKKK
ncbi:MAG: hypothetical protein MSG78_06565 [Clostridiales bacterium]|nr:hypothetical protein [Clostridiales bacterium]